MPDDRRPEVPSKGNSPSENPGEPSGIFKLIGDVIVFFIRLTRNQKAPAMTRREYTPAPLPRRKAGRTTSRSLSWDTSRETSAQDAEETIHSRRLPRSYPQEWRVVRIAVWRIGRPFVRFHRRTSPRNLFLIYLAPLLALSVVFTAVLLPHKSKPKDPSTSRSPEDTMRILLAQTAAQLQNNDAKAAWVSIEQLRKMDPKNAAIETMAGTALAMREDYPQALAAFRTALSIDPKSIAAKNNLAEIEFASKNYAEAERLYRELLPSTPRQALIAYHIYLCLLLQHHNDEAAEIFAKLPRPPAASSPAWYFAQAGRAYLEGNAAQGRKYLEDAKNFYPELSPLYEPSLKQLGFIK